MRLPKEEYLEKKKQKQFANSLKEYHVNKNTTLLEYLYEVIKNESRNNVKKILSSRCVLVNGLVVTQFDYNLYQKDIVYISKKPVDKDFKLNKKENKVINQIKLDIIYEDDELIVINKPAGLLSIESDNNKTSTAYKEVLLYMQNKDKHSRCFQVHRLDKETSGVLLFTKNEELKNKLVKNWNTLVKVREYIAVVEGRLEKKQDTIIQHLDKDSNNLMYVSNNKSTPEAITKYKVLKENNQYTMVDCFIETGKKNQIRVAFNSLNHPILGDDKYGKPASPLKRLCLHAKVLKIKHPIKKIELTFKANYPKEFNKLFD